MSNDASTTPRGAAQLRRDISSTRRELAETLDALEYKLDVPARASEWIDDRVDQVKRAWDENPGLVIGIAAGAATIVIGVIAGAFTLPRRGR
ncbi:DUF3618 domain-containing protein [Gulosibacter macacae]|uniref:DUF3618 domain-containing protein n=1 Tax=Gulosibacter macacae TaxID=2488791 RepID=A0A3P3VUF5_9MICO|nr:DUF3618 domain-containing protein [Gulosibacter macacae]RRJ85957.1 DUF3618 domain-containing protein [Gulosibacter macacae]